MEKKTDRKKTENTPAQFEHRFDALRELQRGHCLVVARRGGANRGDHQNLAVRQGALQQMGQLGVLCKKERERELETGN